MNRPDFSRYSEAQLRQILGRLDRERFPDRVKEVETRLAAFESQGNRCRPDTDPASGERRLISSNLSVFTNAVFPFFWFGICLFLAISLFLSKSTGIAEWLILFACLAFGAMAQLGIDRLADKVYLAGDALIVVRKGVAETICLSSIDEIEVTGGETTTVILHLVQPAQCGPRIEFVPAAGFTLNPFGDIAVVKELRVRVLAAKAATTQS